MKYMSMLAILTTLAALAPAQAEETADAEELAGLRLQARSLEQKAQTMHAEAAQRYASTERACMDKFLVAACLEDAKKTKMNALREAKRVEQEARGIERQVKAREREEKQARRLAEAPERNAEVARRAEKSRGDYAEALQRVERKQAESARRDSK